MKNSFHKIVSAMRKNPNYKFVSAEWRDGVFSEGYWVLTWKAPNSMQIFFDDLPNVAGRVGSIYTETNPKNLTDQVLHVKYLI
jgi:hypothetical protein